MIINLLINLVLLIFGSLLLIFPEVTLSTIPFAGPFISDTLTSAVHIWNAFLSTFPYAQTPWDLFLFIILPFEGLMLLGKFFLGHRMPSNNN